MPKTAVDEYRDALSREKNVGPASSMAFQRWAIDEEPKPLPVEE